MRHLILPCEHKIGVMTRSRRTYNSSNIRQLPVVRRPSFTAAENEKWIHLFYVIWIESVVRKFSMLAPFAANYFTLEWQQLKVVQKTLAVNAEAVGVWCEKSASRSKVFVASASVYQASAWNTLAAPPDKCILPVCQDRNEVDGFLSSSDISRKDIFIQNIARIITHPLLNIYSSLSRFRLPPIRNALSAGCLLLYIAAV